MTRSIGPSASRLIDPVERADRAHRTPPGCGSGDPRGRRTDAASGQSMDRRRVIDPPRDPRRARPPVPRHRCLRAAAARSRSCTVRPSVVPRDSWPRAAASIWDDSASTGASDPDGRMMRLAGQHDALDVGVELHLAHRLGRGHPVVAVRHPVAVVRAQDVDGRQRAHLLSSRDGSAASAPPSSSSGTAAAAGSPAPLGRPLTAVPTISSTGTDTSPSSRSGASRASGCTSNRLGSGRPAPRRVRGRWRAPSTAASRVVAARCSAAGTIAPRGRPLHRPRRRRVAARPAMRRVTAAAARPRPRGPRATRRPARDPMTGGALLESADLSPPLVRFAGISVDHGRSGHVDRSRLSVRRSAG